MKMADFSGKRVVGSRTLAVMLLANALVWISFQARAAAQTYDGPLVDSHAHIAIYRSQVADQEVQYRVDAREGATELTAASYVSSLDRNNIKCTVGFHGIAFDSKQQELLDHARRLLLLYPDRFILFAEIFRHNPLEWFFDADGLGTIFDTGLFAGLGEIQFENPPLDLDETTQKDTLPNDKRFQPIYRLLGDRGLVMMGHPATRAGLQMAVRFDPRVTWIIHGPQVHGRWNTVDVDGDGTSADEMEEMEGVLNRNPNLYYTLDIGESLQEFFDYFLTSVHSVLR